MDVVERESSQRTILCGSLRGSMGLTRKIRKVGDSPTVAIPAQLAPMLGLEAGDQLEFDHIGDGILRLRRAKA